MARTGARLREARLAKNISLQAIAASTKLSVSALEAIEREEIGRLPGGIFLRSFVKAYAVEVGLNPDEIVAEFLREFPVESTLADVEAAAAAAEAAAPKVSRGWVAVAAAGVVPLLGAGAWVTTSAGWWDGMAARVASEARPATAPVTTASVTPAPYAAAQPLPTARLVSVDDESPGLPVLAIHPSSTCWVQVTIGGQVRLSRLMQAGEREQFELTGPVLVEVGDAGAFDFSIDEVPGRPLGSVGQVVRTRIDPERVADFVLP